MYCIHDKRLVVLYTPNFEEVSFSMHLQLELFKKDVESLQEELMSVSSMDTSQISLYEYFHISPIKVFLFHVSD